MGFFDFLKPKKKESLYSGGDGSSKETAVVINATNSIVGVAAEYKFIEKQCGRKDTDWERDLQMVLRSDNKNYHFNRDKRWKNITYIISRSQDGLLIYNRLHGHIFSVWQASGIDEHQKGLSRAG